MQDIILDIKTNSQNILPVPYSEPPVPLVEKPVNYGKAPYPMPQSIISKTTSRKDDDLQYCNFLEPSPRDQRLNIPYEGKKDCPIFNTQPYNKDSCYLLDSNAQGVVGIVCNESGGSNNANFYRGNQFAVDYKDNMNNKQLEYIVHNPVQIPMEMQNPMIAYDKGTFYPEPSFSIRKNANFLTYPLQNNYTENGMPTYRYPYKTMNPIIESFDNEQDTTTKMHAFFIFLLITFFIIFLFMRS